MAEKAGVTIEKGEKPLRTSLLLEDVQNSTSQSPAKFMVHCRRAEGPLNEKLDRAAKEERVKLVYGGSQAEWRDLSPEKKSPWREEPWGVDRLLAVAKITGEKWEKLIEEDCYDEKKLNAFVRE
ncbi:hypothetical protein EYC84_010579 [Monilinia fructicola]|uniref:Uncharacterized protein n=1 Tax=Monilinia fructicola TaxID=38448 RepID=A0A5M9J5R3_MONFR|nr:hypothetical protein EYC84_010579 [Monilinia fructicola]